NQGGVEVEQNVQPLVISLQRLRPWHIFKISLALVGSVAGDIHTVGQTQGVQDALVTLVILNHGLADVERAHHVLILQLTNTESVHHQCAFFFVFCSIFLTLTLASVTRPLRMSMETSTKPGRSLALALRLSDWRVDKQNSFVTSGSWVSPEAFLHASTMRLVALGFPPPEPPA
uniref:Uncharacterized protein n=1 Tax=Triticum urartu TaxID=4572 RepID=A0A8R7UE01_TRIUA